MATDDRLQRIADEIGVSPNTVLRVLRGENKEVWPGTAQRAQRIRALADALGYRPHGSARSMRSGRFDAVALLLSADRGRSHLPEDLLNGIADACDAARQRLILAKVSDARLSDREQLPRILAESSSDGLLINYTDRIPAAMPGIIARCRIPAVWINSRHDHDAVWYDDRGGAAAAVRRLAALGHRRIAWLDFVGTSEDDPHYSRVERRAGVMDALAACALPAMDPEGMAGTPVHERLAATLALLRRTDRPTAIIAYDHPERVLLAAALAGLRVPQDLSVIAFAPADGTERADAHQGHIGRKMAALAVPGEAAGHAAVAMLLAKIAADGAPQPAMILPVPLLDGDSLAAPGGPS